MMVFSAFSRKWGLSCARSARKRSSAARESAVSASSRSPTQFRYARNPTAALMQERYKTPYSTVLDSHGYRNPEPDLGNAEIHRCCACGFGLNHEANPYASRASAPNTSELARPTTTLRSEE